MELYHGMIVCVPCNPFLNCFCDRFCDQGIKNCRGITTAYQFPINSVWPSSRVGQHCFEKLLPAQCENYLSQRWRCNWTLWNKLLTEMWTKIGFFFHKKHRQYSWSFDIKLNLHTILARQVDPYTFRRINNALITIGRFCWYCSYN